MTALTAPIRILIVAALCVAGLIGLVVRETMARAEGTEITLAMEAVDPRALLMGHYVIINLQEALPVGTPCPPGTEPGTLNTGWLALTQNGDVHSVASVSATKEEAKRVSPIVAKGNAYCNVPFVNEGEQPTDPAVIRYDVGIERFYTEQEEAERIERVLREQEPGQDALVYAIVSVGEDGQARLKGLIVDNERFDLTL